MTASKECEYPRTKEFDILSNYNEAFCCMHIDLCCENPKQSKDLGMWLLHTNMHALSFSIIQNDNSKNRTLHAIQ